MDCEGKPRFAVCFGQLCPSLCLLRNLLEAVAMSEGHKNPRSPPVDS